MGTSARILAGAFVVSAVALGALRKEEPPLRLGEPPTAKSGWSASVSKPAPVATAAIAPRPTVDKSPSMQEGRSKLIRKLINAGVFMKTGVPGSLPRVWVGRGFYALPFDQKQQFVSVVLAYYGGDMVSVYDGYTDKTIGRMTADGLTLK